MHTFIGEPNPLENTLSDIDLLRRLKGRDLLAYRELIGKYYEFVYAVAFVLHRDEQVANQYVMDIFSYTWNHADCLSFKGTIKQYFFKLIYAKYQRYASVFPVEN
jgi:hypothetical protein